MPLSLRPQVYSLPSYSLTGDLLGYLRCGLQYRYTRIGKLPPSRPVQQWFGEFLHGVLEESFRRYRDSIAQGCPSLPPWTAVELADIRRLIKARLGAKGLYAWTPTLEKLGDKRADTAIQDLGPHLFPLIHQAEVRLTGARRLPPIPNHLQFRVADRYEMAGVVDVVTHLQLGNPQFAGNPIVRAINATLGAGLPSVFEVIIDYKGMRRPPLPKAGAANSAWTQYQWQLQTYASLRRKQAGALTVVAGVLLYLNELFPTRSDLQLLQNEITNGETDVPPPLGSTDAVALAQWKKSSRSLPTLSFDYRLARALRIVPINGQSIAAALQAFDGVVQHIETCRGQEFHGLPVLQAWTRNSADEHNCVVCDSRTYCPDYQIKYAAKHNEQQPKLPGV